MNLMTKTQINFIITNHVKQIVTFDNIFWEIKTLIKQLIHDPVFKISLMAFEKTACTLSTIYINFS